MQSSYPRQLALPGPSVPGRMAKNLIAPLLRRRRVLVIIFLIVFLPIAAAVLFLPGDYVSETKILVQRQRFDPVITANSATQDASTTQSMTRLQEEDVDSEIDLLEGDDLLRQVVVQSGLWDHVPTWRRSLPIPLAPKEERIAKGVRHLRDALEIEPPNRSNIVTVRYHSSNPKQAAAVLKSLANAYLEKHIEVHRPAGSTEFFKHEVEQNRHNLQQATQRLAEFTTREGVVSADAENNTLLQKISEFDASLQNAKGQISSTQQRIQNLQIQLSKTSPRITTQVKTSAVAIDGLKSHLYELQAKRSELLTKYQPGYRTVKDIDQQIADTQAAITKAETSPSAERTTDEDPVYLLLTSDLAKAQSELAALRASETQTERTLADYRARAVRLEQLGNVQQELLRNQKAAEEIYVASVRKQSDARLSEALDRSRIMNVAIAEAPGVPALPASSPGLRLAGGFGFALLVAIALAFIVDYLDPYFRTRVEVEDYLGLPVLASVSPVKMLPASTAGITVNDFPK